MAPTTTAAEPWTTRALALSVSALLALGLGAGLGIVLPAGPAAAGGKSYQTLLKSHGLKEQACLDRDGVASFRGDGRRSERHSAELTWALSRGDDLVGSGGFSITAGKRTFQGAQSAAGEQLELTMKVYRTGRHRAVDHDAITLAIDSLAAC